MSSGLKRWDAAGWDRAAAAHLLGRAGFGSRPGELDAAVEAGFDAALAALFEPRGHEASLLAGVESLLALDDVRQVRAWWMALILGGGDPLRERIALFWHDHFATSAAKVRDVRMLHAQNRLFRERGLGDFRELLHAVVSDPAMLVFLDGDDNVRGRPNENLARELMELFALGIGSYTEHDVREAARALTGFGTEGRSFRFDRGRHDDGSKRIFGREGRFDGHDAVDVVLEHPACRRHIARRLLEELVHPRPAPALVEETAEYLAACDWNLERTVRCILSSEAFFAPEARRSRIAGPVELVARSALVLGARIAPLRAADAAAAMGQALFAPPSVKGWDGGRRWIDAGTWIERTNFLLELASGEIDRPSVLGSPSAHRELVQRACRALLPDLDDERFVQMLGEACDSAEGDVGTSCIAWILTSPEYHLA